MRAPAARLAVVLAAALVAVAPARAQPMAPEKAAEPMSGPVAGTTYAVDPTHTFVIYEIGHYGTTTNRGRFSTQDGAVRIAADGTSARIDVTMDLATINTGVDLLNRHVQSRDFLDVAGYPTARFVAERAPLVDGRLPRAEGTLELHGATRPVTLVAKRFNCYRSPMVDRQVCGGDFEATIRRSDFGITWGLNFGFEDEVKLLIQIEAVAVPAR